VPDLVAGGQVDGAGAVVAGERVLAGELARFAARWEHRRWAVEGCHRTGRSLAQRLVADGETVLDVPAKLAARVPMYSQGQALSMAGSLGNRPPSPGHGTPGDRRR
jgi:hypothetical protein